MALLSAYAVPHPPLIVPSVGRGQERAISSTIAAYEEVARRIRALKPDTIVISSPHAPFYRDGFFLSQADSWYGDMARFRAPQNSLEVAMDKELSQAILQRARGAYQLPITDVGADEDDHGTFVPLYFIRDCLPQLKLVRMGLSYLSAESHRDLGLAVAEAAEDLGRRIVYIASGDLSHKLTVDGPYGFDPAGPVFDDEIKEIFTQGDLESLYHLDPVLCEDAAECGLRSFWIMTGALESIWYRSELLSLEGPFGVGYGVAAFEPLDHEDEVNSEGDPYVELARTSVEYFVREGKPLSRPDNLPSELLDGRAGVFVSIHKGDDLRGCIGTIQATRSCIADEIIRNGVAAASEDPRFSPIRPDELDYLSYSVDVLDQAEPVHSIDELDATRYGVIVTQGWKRGLLLPNLEGVDSVEEQLAIAKRKAGIAVNDDDVAIERFEVVRHEQ